MRALVLCDDPFHPAATARTGLKPIEANDVKFEYVEDGNEINSALVKKFPLVVLAKSNAVSRTNKRPWLQPKMATFFQEHIRNGHGLLVIHSGTVGYRASSPMDKVIGGQFLEHPDPCKMIIKSKVSHSITEGVSPFTIHDEQYSVSVESDVKIILISHSKYGIRPAGWIRQEGRGRICVLTSGHHVEVWLHPSFQKILLNALQWVANSHGL